MLPRVHMVLSSRSNIDCPKDRQVIWRTEVLDFPKNENRTREEENKVYVGI